MNDYDNSTNRYVMLNRIIKKLGFDDFDEDEFNKKINDLLNEENENIMSFTSTDIKSPLEDSLFILIYDPKNNHSYNKIIEELELKLEEESIWIDKKNIMNFNIKVIEIFNSRELKNEINRSKNDVRKIRKSIQDFIITKFESEQQYSLSNIEYLDYFLPDTNIPQKFTIKIDDRVRSIKNLSKDDIKLTSYVFTANVSDIIKIYNTMGDSLFKKNVRIGDVKDNIGVGPAIQDTYKNNPAEFWHLNNGISLLIEGEEDIDLSVFDRVIINTNTLKAISIINGAQTITALSKTKFKINKEELKKYETDTSSGNDIEAKLNDENKTLEIKRKEAEDNAKVLLRIYSIVYQDDKVDKKIKQQNFIEKITLSLNRQKPIKQEDMSYMTNFVKNISHIHNFEKSELKGFTFKFTRSGETGSTVLKEYSLGYFAKIVKAYLLGEPGQARTNAYATLLKTENMSSDTKTPKLRDTKIFKIEMQKERIDEEENELLKYFNKNYKPVNFAFDMKQKLEHEKTFSKLIEKHIEEEKEDNKQYKNNIKTFGKYGVYLLIALYINSENEGLDENYNKEAETENYFNYLEKDFSKWVYQKVGRPTEKLNETDSTVLNYHDWEKKILKIIKVFGEYIKTEYSDEDVFESNDYKNDEISKKLYRKLKKEKKK